MITRLNTDLSHISRMDTLPNDSAGWTAEQVKAEFDRAANEIKAYINSVLLPFLEGLNGAGNVGITPIPAVTGAMNVQAALEKIELQMADMTQGAVADGSITEEKLADGAVTAEKLAGGIDSEKIVNGAITQAKLADASVTAAKLAALCVITEKLADLSVTTAKLAEKAVTTAKIADAAVGTEQLDALSVTNAKLGNGAVTEGKISNGAVTINKLAPNAVSNTYTATIPTGWSGSAPCVQTVTVAGITSGDTPIIDLVPSSTFATAEVETEAWGCVYRAVTGANSVTFYATEKPSVALNIQIKVVRR